MFYEGWGGYKFKGNNFGMRVVTSRLTQVTLKRKNLLLRGVNSLL